MNYKKKILDTLQKRLIHFLNTYSLYIASIGVIVFLLPVLLLGENLALRVHDMLDSSFIRVKILSEQSSIFGIERIPNIMSGLPPSAYPSPLSFGVLLFVLFNPLLAIQLHIFLAHTVAFTGFYLLTKDYFTDEDEQYLSVFTAFIFALLPFWYPALLSIAGIPLIWWAFANIATNKKIKLSFLLIACFPLFSSLVFSGVFIAIFTTSLIVIHGIQKRKIPWKLLTAMGILTVVYLGVEYRLFYQTFFGKQFVSHRIEFVPGSVDWERLPHYLLEIGKSHAISFSNIIIPISLLSFIAVWFKKKKFPKVFGFLIGGFLLLVSFSVLFDRTWFVSTLSIFGSFIQSFQWDRFYVLFPPLAFILLLYTVIQIHKSFKYGAIFSLSLLLFVQLYIAKYWEYGNGKMFAKQVVIPEEKSFSYKEYYSYDLFNKLKQEIDEPLTNFRVGSIGLDPVIAAFNGFYTIDGYVSNYPVSYKHKFYEIIKDEVNKTKELEDYYLNWGSRCYLFTEEIARNVDYPKLEINEIDEPDYNYSKLKEMNVKYLISAVEVSDLKNLSLVIKVSDQQRDLYLYSIQ